MGFASWVCSHYSVGINLIDPGDVSFSAGPAKFGNAKIPSRLRAEDSESTWHTTHRADSVHPLPPRKRVAANDSMETSAVDRFGFLMCFSIIWETLLALTSLSICTIAKDRKGAI